MELRSRFCVDYRRLNSLTKMDTFPLPRIDDSLDLLANTAFFNTLNLASGYWQVEMDSESRQKTVFCSYSGLHKFNVMLFGLCITPATFNGSSVSWFSQREVHCVFGRHISYRQNFEKHFLRFYCGSNRQG